MSTEERNVTSKAATIDRLRRERDLAWGTATEAVDLLTRWTQMTRQPDQGLLRRTQEFAASHLRKSASTEQEEG